MTSTLFVALAGGLGAIARYALDVALTGRLGQSWVRLSIINVTGSALLGLIAGLSAAQLVPPVVHVVVGAGFLGGYTTFSAASLATARLIEERRWLGSLLSSVGMLLASTGAAALGLVVGRTL